LPKKKNVVCYFKGGDLLFRKYWLFKDDSDPLYYLMKWLCENIE